jgi:nucleotide-binding universal stress UspA family protein
MIKRLLVPIDMSEHSFAALAYAVNLAETFHAEIILLNVIERDEDLVDRKDLRSNFGDASTIAETNRKEELVKKLIELDFICKPIALRIYHGAPAKTIVQAAAELKVDIIIMSTHGRSGIDHILLGSVAEKVVRYATCAVLTLKPEHLQALDLSLEPNKTERISSPIRT